MRVMLFISTDCQICYKMKNIVASIADEKNIDLEIIWKQDDKKAQFGRWSINSIPHMMIMKTENGELVPVNNYCISNNSRAELTSLLTKYKDL